MRIAILTAITRDKPAGLSDPVLGPAHEGVDYFAFVDKPFPCNVWNQIQLPNFSNIDQWTGRRNAKYPKVLGSYILPGYDFYIWQDSYMETRIPPKIIIENFLCENADIALFKHPDRDCVYDEMNFVKQINYDNHSVIDECINFYRTRGYPEKNGMFELSAFVYRNNEKVRLFMLSWWEMIAKFSSRDQCTFPYLMWKYNLKYNLFPGTARPNNGGNIIFPTVRPY